MDSLEINIIQGTNDKYGTKAQLDELLSQFSESQINISYIENADHSYRNSDKLPVFQDRAIDLINL